MQSSILSLLALGLAFCSPASAVYSYSTLSLCTTKFGLISAPVKSSGLSVTVPITYTQKTTLTPVSTVTPSPTSVFITNTITSTVVTTLSPTTTLTITSPAYITNTITASATSTTTIQTTVYPPPSATTVPTAAGFTPLASEPGYVAKRDALVTAKPAIRGRTIEARVASSSQSLLTVGKVNGVVSFSPPMYPTLVICGTLVEAISTVTQTSTASTTSTKTLPPATNTITNTASTTTTATSVLAPATVSTTTVTTLTTSTTVTNTLVTSTTATQTVLSPPTSTVYDACQANNDVGSANGLGIYGLGHNSNTNLQRINPTDFNTCCGTCQTVGGCQGFVFYPAGDCYLVIGNTCDGSQTFGNVYYTNPSLPPNSNAVVGNGPCGQLGPVTNAL